MSKVLLLGMNNPISDDPKFDLFPYPEDSTGYLLWKMMPDGTSRSEYVRAFERRNLLRARQWDALAAQDAARAVRPTLDGRVVVVLGTEVRKALGLAPAEPLSCNDAGGFRWVAVPHPSGRNRWFNEPANFELSRRVLAALFRASLADDAYLGYRCVLEGRI